MVVAKEAATRWSSYFRKRIITIFLPMAKRYLQYVHALCSFPIKGTCCSGSPSIDKQVIED
jgi:hypothetical protein